MLSRLMLSPHLPRIAKSFAAALICAVGCYVLATTLDQHYPLKEWLIWRLAPIWGYALLFNVSCVAMGSFLLRKLLGFRELPALERLLQSMALGLVAFVLALYALGFVGLLKPWSALLVPGAFLILGADDGRALLVELGAWRSGIPRPRALERVLGSCAIAFGGICLCFLYLEALDPAAINYDATWYHFPIAQDYARVGRIFAFPGENHRTFPHLTSLVHTWALLVPGIAELPRHWMLSLHLEFCIVVWRMLGAAAVARWLLGGRDVRGLWAGFFLFPSVFVYDQAIGGSADHFLGFFAAPALLAGARAVSRFDLRFCILCGVALGGHMLVKYQAAYLIAGMAVLVCLALAYHLLRRVLGIGSGAFSPDAPGPRQLLLGAGAVALSAALVASPHFVKNAVFYNNPAYPFAKSIFKSTYPAPVPGYYREKSTKGSFLPKHSGLQRQAWALGKMFDYSLTTANRNLTKHRPYMGALFSLLLPCALLLRGRKRYLLITVPIAIAFMVWANTAANDRYLLGFYDLCIGTALALLVGVWELGWLARAGLVPLAALQLVWGGDSMLYYGRKELEAALDMIAEGYDGDYDRRIVGKSLQRQITEATPKDAVILSRNYKGLLGLDRLVLSDIRANQDYIVYSGLEDPRQFWDLLKQRGITHLLYPKNDRRPGRWNNAILFAEIFRRGEGQRRFGKLALSRVPTEPPPPSKPYLVLVSGASEYPEGIYKLQQLDVDYRDPAMFTPKPKPFRRANAGEPTQTVAELQAVVICRKRLPKGWSEELLSDFETVESFDGCEYRLKRR
jgi:hypothetical protein